MSPVEVAQYAKKRELGDKALETQLFQFSQGVPWLLAAEVMLQGEGQKEMIPAKTSKANRSDDGENILDGLHPPYNE